MKEQKEAPHTENTQSATSRREFLSNSIKTAVGTSLAMSLPTIVPFSVFGRNAPSNRINIGAIGTGRISRIHDLPGVWQYDFAQVVAVCDVDSKRAEDGKKLTTDLKFYTRFCYDISHLSAFNNGK